MPVLRHIKHAKSLRLSSGDNAGPMRCVISSRRAAAAAERNHRTT